MAITESTLRGSSILSFLTARTPFAYVARFRVTLGELQTRRRYRKDLERFLRVGPHMIEDVGLTLPEAHREIEKPLWQA
jgi:uncharacterized protein YjiS (DUF1127 family)